MRRPDSRIIQRNRLWEARYAAGESMGEIARSCGVSSSTVYSVLERMKVERRPQGRPQGARAERTFSPEPYLSPGVHAQDTAVRDARKAAEQGSAALAKALWAYGAKHGLPNIPRELCERLAGG